MLFHVLNRGVGRRSHFSKEGDFLAFERVLEESLRTRPMRLCAYCLYRKRLKLSDFFSSRKISDKIGRMQFDAESLAFCRLAATRRRPGRLHAQGIGIHT
jgi:hypothetical protein